MLRILLRCLCKNCAHKIDFPAGQAGKIVTCPKCQAETELVQPDKETESIPAEPVRTTTLQTTTLAVAPRLGAARDFTREIGLRTETHSQVKRAISERKGVSSVFKVTCSLIGVALIAAGILFFDEIKAFVLKL